MTAHHGLQTDAIYSFRLLSLEGLWPRTILAHQGESCKHSPTVGAHKALILMGMQRPNATLNQFMYIGDNGIPLATVSLTNFTDVLEVGHLDRLGDVCETDREGSFIMMLLHA